MHTQYIETWHMRECKYVILKKMVCTTCLQLKGFFFLSKAQSGVLLSTGNLTHMIILLPFVRITMPYV